MDATDEQLRVLYPGADGETIVLVRKYLAGDAVCRVCGCTNERACVGGCWWVDVDLCSWCALTDPVLTAKYGGADAIAARRAA